MGPVSFDFTMPRIQHIHIPKCAGNSVFHGMRDALGSRRTLVLDSVATYLAARRLRKCRNEFEFESHHLEVKQTLLALYLEQGFEIISGHLPFSPLCAEQFGEAVRYVTLLRDPVERLKSHVAYLIFAQPRTSVEDYSTGVVDPADEVVRILQREEIGIWMARSQCVYLGGLASDGKADLDARVDHAIAALDRLDLVGFDDDLPAFASAFELLFGCPLKIGKENTIRSVQPDPALLKRVYDVFEGSMKPALLEMCEDDQALFEAARNRFA